MEDYPQAKNETEARQKHEELKNNPELFNCAKDQTAFLNIFFGRMWHDLHNNKDFVDFLREKITRKLLKVKVNIKLLQSLAVKLAICQPLKNRCCCELGQHKSVVNTSF